jgi:hypothetical protein
MYGIALAALKRGEDMRLLFMSAVLFAFGLILTGCYASPELGFDPWSSTVASQIRLYRSEIAYKITCENGTRFCLQRAEAICGGRYLIAGWPQKSPRAQVLLNMRIETVNTDNPSIIKIVCD